MDVLVRDGVGRTLIRLAVPMLAGTFALNAYNLTDTWFVSRLGVLPLAAMGFTFPVVMLLGCVAGGLGSGITPLVAHALGRRDNADAARLATHGLVFVLTITAVMTVGGYCTIGPVFRALGADAQTLPLIADYMGIWYFGAWSVFLPMLGNGLLISLGDSRSAARLMMLGTLLNALLDPVMIFGWCGFPRMEMRGAALATVISQAVSASFLFYLLMRKHRLLAWSRWTRGDWLNSLRRILSFGVPGILSMILMPISAAALTWILGRFGNEAVAACGAAGRIEMFAFMVPMALGMSLTPFMSRNYGAARLDRVWKGAILADSFAILYGLGIAILFYAFSGTLARVFGDDPKMTAILTDYIRIIAFGYGLMEVHRYSTFVLTGLQMPRSATALNMIRTLVFLLPLLFLGAKFGGIRGVFWGRLATDVLVGALGMAWVFRVLRARRKAEAARDESQPARISGAG